MYLTRVTLDINKRKTQLALSAPGKIHGAVELSFPKKQNRNLWRIDTYNNNMYLLLLSSEIPDMTNFISQYGVDGSKAETKDYNLLLSRITKDSIWRFRLVANPTHSIKQQNGRGKVLAHISSVHQLQWLLKQAEQNGFEIFNDNCFITSSEWKSFYKGEIEKSEYQYGKKIRFIQVSYEGLLQVKDPEIFKKSLVNGIGREKAYGMGLLTLTGGN